MTGLARQRGLWTNGLRGTRFFGKKPVPRTPPAKTYQSQVRASAGCDPAPPCDLGRSGIMRHRLARVMDERLAGNPLFRQKAGSPHPSGKNLSTVLAQQSATGMLRAHLPISGRAHLQSLATPSS